MTALSVHQHQRVIVREVAQADRSHQGGRITDGMGGHVERWDQRPQLVVEGGGSLSHHILKRDGVYGDRGFGHRPRLGAAPDDHQFRLQEQLKSDGDPAMGWLHSAFMSLKILCRHHHPVGTGA